MNSFLPIGLSAGLASALLFASVTSGSPFAMVLFYAAPLPILIAGLGWRHYAGLLGAMFAAALLAVALQSVFLLAFLAGIGVPAWLMAYLALLARTNDAGEVEWYPIDRLLVWSAVIAAAGVAVGVIGIGFSADSYDTALKGAVEQVLRSQAGTASDQPLTLPGVTDPEAMVRLMVAVLPPTAAVLSMLTALLNLWAAARVVRASGRLARPWPDLTTLRLPSFAAPMLAAAVALTLVGGVAGVVGGLFVATLVLAYAMAGLSLLHAMTRGAAGRGFILFTVYGAVLIFGWPLLFAAVAGFADSFLALRARSPGRRGPPAANDK